MQGGDSRDPNSGTAPAIGAGLALVAFLGVGLPLLGGAVFDAIAPGLSLDAIPLHSLVEGAGGAIALLLAALLRVGVVQRGRRHPELWIGAALVGMGTLDLVHAAVAPGNAFVFLHSAATFVGGLFFAGAILPARWTNSGRLDLLPLGVFGGAIGLALWAVLAPATLPPMLHDGEFTRVARGLNVAGGLLFFAAAVHFARALRTRRTWDPLLFAAHCTLFGSAGVLFDRSSLWDGPWWWWHALRLGAYVVAMAYMLYDYSRGQERVATLLEEVDATNRALEGRVAERTEELAATNQRLTEEMRERERLEKVRWEARLEHAQKLESLGVLAGGIAHDFNNLLVGMLGNASIALEDVPREHKARESIEHIERAARRAAELTRQMLAYSGKGRFVVEPLDLSEVVDEMRDLLEVSINKKASLVRELGRELPLVRADATQLRQVVMNLITNASDALEDKPGSIRLSTGLVQADAAYLDEMDVGSEATPGTFVYLEVTDTGQGMDEETRVRMFDPFFTTKASGRGLGLAATLGILRGHGGAIRVYSESGKGSAIKILLPADAQATRRVATTSTPVPLTGLMGCVLVVDDQEVVRRLARRALERAGLSVVTADDGAEALELFEADPHRFDLVLLDLTMPRVSGEETFAAMRRKLPGVRVLLMSGYNAQDTTSRFVGKGLAGFLQKPFTAQELVAKVAALLAAR